MAVAHNIGVMVSHRLAEGTVDEKARDQRRSPPQEERQRRRAVQVLPALGSRVT
jgi:hypothetical protein